MEIKKPQQDGSRARLAQIVSVLTKHKVILALAEQKHPEWVRESFEELGPTFVKIGQILSTRTDIISEEFSAELKKLQDHVKTDTYESVCNTILEESGHPVEELFEKFEEKPLASASIAQVHAAVLKGGQRVVVKVQHPGIYDAMFMDITLLEKAVPLIKFIPVSGMTDPASIVSELKHSLLNELDFTKEADNIEKFGELNANVPYILAPAVYRTFSSRRLLIMDFMQGVQIANYIELSNAEVDKGNTSVLETKKRLAKEIVDNYVKQIFDDGFFHADPHPGNILVTLETPPADPSTVSNEGSAVDDQKEQEQPLEKNLLNELPLDIDVTVAGVSLSTIFRNQDVLSLFAGTAKAEQAKCGPERIVFIDFGMMGTLDERTLEKFNTILAAVHDQDNKKIAKGILSLCKTKVPVDLDDFTEDIGKLLERYYDMPIGDMSLPAVFEDINDLCTRYQLQLPQNIALLVKGVGTIEGIVLALDPDCSVMSAVMPYAKRYLQKQFDAKHELTRLLKDLYRAGKTIPEFPVKITKALDTLTRGEIKLNMETKNLDDLFIRLETMVNRLVMGLIVAALIVGSSMLIHFADSAQTIASNFGMVGYTLAIVLVVILVFQTYRKRK